MSDPNANDNPQKTHEYAGERDMDRFWNVAQSVTEPFQQWWYLPVVLVLVVASVPWYRTSGLVGELVGGLPGWVWTSLLCTVGLSTLIAVGVLWFWRDDADNESVETATLNEEPPDDA